MFARLTVTLALLAIVLVACSGTPNPSATTTGDDQPAPSVSAAVEPTPTPAGPGATLEPGDDAPAPGGVAAALAALDALHSFRYEATITTVAEGQESVLSVAGTVINRPQRAVAFTLGGDEGMEWVVVGERAWMKLGDEWTEMPADEAQVESYHPAEMFADNAEMMAEMQLVGSDTRNGIAVDHYRGGDDAGPMGSWHGEMWIARDGGYIVGQELSVEDFMGSGGTMRISLNLSHANDPTNVVRAPR